MAKTAIEPTRSVHLGFEVGSGEPVTIPVRHMCVTGQTQEAGKTTTLEALIARSGLSALTFVTKRGEGAFVGGRATRPYFREQADWRFVSSMLEAFLGERLKFERSWIMRASKGARTLADVRRNVARLMEKAKGLNADVFMVLGEYLDELVPAIARVDWAMSVDLAHGVNVMDLTTIPASLQHLVIKSSIDWVLEKVENTIVVVPEAWKFIPQGRGTPVKLSAQAYIRQGAGLRNYLWLDSQDIGGIDKEVLRSVPVWILGVQREANEIKRTLSNIPATVAKPKAAEIATLELGQFVACFGKHAVKTYVQPAWLPDAHAIRIAKGEEAVGDEYVRDARPRPRGPDSVESMLERVTHEMAPGDVVRLEIPATQTAVEAVQKFVARGQRAQAAVNETIAKGSEEMNPEQEKKLDDLVASVRELVTAIKRPGPLVPPASVWTGPVPQVTAKAYSVEETMDNETLYQAIKARLLAEAADDPRILEVLVQQPEIRVRIARHTIEVGDDTLRGRLALLIHEGFFDEAKESGKAFAEVTRRGFKTAHPNVSRELQELARMGFLTRSNKWYAAVAAMKRNVVAA